MDLMQVRRRMMVQTKKSRLPKEYQEVEYIESTGTQWIDTDIYTSLSDNTEYDAVVGYWTPSKTRRQLMGGDYGAYFGVTTSNRYEIGTTSSIIPSTSEYDVIHFQQDIANRRQILTVNGTKFIRNYFTNWQANLISIFHLTSPVQGHDYHFECSCRLKMFRITRNQTILGNFVPCYRKSDGEIGMYDLVSNTFFTNQGTGTFLKGADV